MKLRQLVKDLDPKDVPSGFYTDALNAVKNEKIGSISNELGFKDLGLYKEGLRPNGIVYSSNEQAIIFSINSNVLETGVTTHSEIGVLNLKNNNYRTVLVNSGLNFSPIHPISGTANFNRLNEIIVVFTDDFNNPKVLNVDNIGYPVDINYEMTGGNDVTVFNLFPKFTQPTYTLTTQSGGSLLSGAYSFAISYINNLDIETDATYFSPFIYISELEALSFGGVGLHSNAPNNITNRSIKIIIGGIVEGFRQFKLYKFEKINGISNVYEVGTYEITGSSITLNITGNEELIPVDTSSILIKNPEYNRVKSFTQVGTTLFGANLSEVDNVNLQKYLLNARIKYVKENVNLKPSVTSILDTADIKTFRHFEVYSFYVVPELTNGRLGKAFHIPGRAPIATDIELVLGNIKRYEALDTCNDDGTMGYWENDDETYPNLPEYDASDIGGLDLRGEKVRHHRFPSLRYLKDEFGTSATGVSTLHRLGVRVENIDIPENLRSKIKRFRLYYVEKNFGNSTVVGNGLFTFGGKTESGTADPNRKLAGGLNFIINGGTNNKILVDTTYLRFHSPDLMFGLPAVSPNLIRNEIKLEINKDVNNQAATSLNGRLDTGITNSKRLVIDYTEADSVSALSVVDDILRQVNNGKYIAADGYVDDIDNRSGDEIFYVEIDGGSTLDIDVASEFNSANLKVETFISTLLTNIKNVHTRIVDSAGKRLVYTGETIPISEATSPYNTVSSYLGDNFLIMYSHLSYAPLDAATIFPEEAVDPNDAQPGRGFVANRRYVTCSRLNLSRRYQVAGNDRTNYFPKTNIRLLFDKANLRQKTEIGYSLDYNSIPNIDNIAIFNPYQNLNIDHPTRLIRWTSANDSLAFWNELKALDFFDNSRQFGEIVNIQGFRDFLFINHRKQMYKTLGTQRLETDQIQIVLGTGEIIEGIPDTLIPTEEGYIGCESQFSCKLIKAGYVVVDRNAGRVFLFSDGVREISKEGLRNYFRDTLKEITLELKIAFEVEINNSVNGGNIQLNVYRNVNDDVIENVKLGEYIWIEYLNTYAVITNIDKTPFDKIVITVDFEYDNTVIVSGNAILETRIRVENPFLDQGVVLGYDDYHNRLLVTNKENAKIDIDNSRYKGYFINKANLTSGLVTGDIVKFNGEFKKIQ